MNATPSTASRLLQRGTITILDYRLLVRLDEAMNGGQNETTVKVDCAGRYRRTEYVVDTKRLLDPLSPTQKTMVLAVAAGMGFRKIGNTIGRSENYTRRHFLDGVYAMRSGFLSSQRAAQ